MAAEEQSIEGGLKNDPNDVSRSSWKNIMIALYWLGLMGLSAAVILSFFARNWWFADLFTHFRVQGFLLGLLLLSIAVSFVYWKSAGLVTLLLIVQGSIIAPYILPRSQPVLPASATSLLVWNVYVGNPNVEKVVELIKEKEADVVVLFEVSPELGVQLGALRDEYPHFEIESSADGFGSAIFSRQPLKEISIRRVGNELDNTVVARFEDGTTLVGVHTLPPEGPTYSRIRNQQLDELAEFIAQQSGPVLVVGDLNITPWSPHFQDLLRDAKLTDPRCGRGVLTSWPKGKPLIRIPIDHILSTNEITLGELRVFPETYGSDHHPIYCRWAVK
ncbi:endonuclease/exonuclease/phosphatase family protein [Planctomycetaceae bacterium]|jgi:endonuclease/exonuclease/phosphatase (EEP) superfamily protein YafD|nr:endonuclease/exonuclease/phosphatase family protein [Planctomycetaceae bacterium]MDG2389641.1 endonuclease/exonuclease/phosphatase family protein [Planctomycetaceae bacterium]